MAGANLLAALRGGSFAHRMGLSAADARTWLAERADPARIALRREVLAAHPERLAVACGREELAPVVAFLRASPASGDGFEACAAAIASDLLIVRRDPPALVAIAVALPSGWAPEDVLGRPVGSIHAIVPGLDAALGARIDPFLRKLEAGRAYARANAGLMRGPALDRHPRSGASRLVAETPLDEVVVRLEEQLFVGLGALVLFAVHLSTTPVPRLDVEERAALAEWLASMPEDVAAYKGVAEVRAALVDHLRAR